VILTITPAGATVGSGYVLLRIKLSP